MIVCVCRRISDREIARHARAGMDFDDIQFELGVAVQCGQCEGSARDVIARCEGGPGGCTGAHMAKTASHAQAPAWSTSACSISPTPSLSSPSSRFLPA
ncbi:MAG: (2Fe-2S)-binding protein [Pseudomonadota bacterium]